MTIGASTLLEASDAGHPIADGIAAGGPLLVLAFVGIALTVGPLFGLGLFWGWLYHRTETLLVPILCLGINNALIFGLAYALG